MKSKRYNIYKLNARKVLAKASLCKKVDNNYTLNFRLDATDASLWPRIAEINELGDCSLFYQINTLTEPDKDQWNKDSLLNSLIYIDFSNAFNNAPSRKRKKDPADSKNKTDFTMIELQKADDILKARLLFANGLDIKLNNETTKHFIPFDKSGSMSRNSVISFLDSDLFAELDKKIRLDIDFHHDEITLSKYYAYRGLHLSEGVRIDPDTDFALNEKTVIVISDYDMVEDDEKEQNNINPDNWIECSAGFITARKENSGDETADDEFIRYKLKYKEQKEDPESPGKLEYPPLFVDPFDGEGIICPEYARMISDRYLASGFEDTSLFPDQGEGQKMLTSFQIRLPFVKGMLHCVDFHSFFNDRICRKDEESGEIFIKDIYGRQRKLSEARIILSESMFKCSKWIKKYAKSSQPCSAEEKEPFDEMAYYFDRLNRYDHALYVTNTNETITNTGKVKTTYQLLNTLALTPSDFESIVKRHFALSDDLSFDELDKQADLSDAIYTDELLSHKLPVYIKAAMLNPLFTGEKKVVDYIDSQRIKMNKEGLHGKLCISGEIRYLSGDLLAFLLRLVSLSTRKETLKSEGLIKLKTRCLYESSFYVPASSAAVAYSKNRWYACYRSPHLSRNEECVLKYYNDPLYEKYFGHLENVVMVGRKSLAPSTLGGADFDGDLITIIDDQKINKAVLKSVYTFDKTSALYKRKLPVISIPALKPKVTDGDPAGPIDFDTIRRSFESRIGYISNAAVQIGKIEYSENAYPQDVLQQFENKSALCTILGGLEIDAAKAGTHPDLTEIKELLVQIRNAQGIKSWQKDYYLEFLEIYDKLSRYEQSIKHETFKIKQAGKDELKFRLKPSDSRDFLEKLEADIIEAKDIRPNLDRLPYQFVLHKKDGRPKKIKTSSVLDKASELYLSASDYRSLDDIAPEKTEALKKVILTCAKLREFNKKAFANASISGNTSLIGNVYKILKDNYGSLDTIVCGEQSVRQIIDDFYSCADACLKNSKEVAAFINELTESYFAFRSENERCQILSKLLTEHKIELYADFEQTKALFRILTNFNNNGYYVLYYLLKDLYYRKISDLVEYFEANLPVLFPDDDALSTEIKTFYQDKAAQLKDKYALEKELRSIIRRHIRNIFDGDLKQAFICSHYLRNTKRDDDPKKRYDENGTFFWEIIPEHVILKDIIVKGEASPC